MDVQITVASKTPGIPGKKQSKVTDTTGKTWQVWNDKFHMFQEGATYLITKHKSSDFNGMTYHTIESFTAVGGVAQAVGNGAAPRAAPRPAIDPSKTDNERRMDIFICGAFNKIMGNPNVHPLDLSMREKAAQVEELRQIWLTTLGPNRPSQISTSPARMNPPAPDREMDDEIPF